MKEPIIAFIPETGETHCIIQDGTKTFSGSAYCHPEDLPFVNRLTGSHIAMTRAYINYLQNMVRMEVK
jgi:hypothetical protein